MLDGGAHRRRHRAEMHGNVLGLHQQFAVRGEHRRRAIGALFDVGAERSAPQHGAHLGRDTREPRDEDLQGGRIEHHASLRNRSAPATPCSADHPAGKPDRAVVLGDHPWSRSFFPRDVGQRGDGGRSTAEGGRSQGDDLDRMIGTHVAVAAFVFSGKRLHRRDRELVALAGVTTVEREFKGVDWLAQCTRPLLAPVPRAPGRPCGDRPGWATNARGRRVGPRRGCPLQTTLRLAPGR